MRDYASAERVWPRLAAALTRAACEPAMGRTGEPIAPLGIAR
jgi:hypothetical protein